jgi:carbonic anhydrase/acetyltransferase-like protein (isoleucine patch superfamily)
MNNQPASGSGTGVASLVALGEHRPVAAESAFIAPGAVLIGRVTVSAQASIWYGAVLRADHDSIFVGERSNIQDGCVLHADLR